MRGGFHLKKNKIVVLGTLALLFVSCTSLYPTKKTNTVRQRQISIERVSKKPMENAYSLLNGKDYPKVEDNYGNEVPYLQPVNDTAQEEFFEKYNEAKALQFFRNLNVKGYGSNSLYWRWKASISKGSLFRKIEERLPQISARGRKNVFVLQNGVWVNNLPISKVGSVKNIKVLSRGASGVITHLLVETSKGSYLVTKEYNIRRLLATNGNIYGAKYGSSYSEKPISSGSALLPSAYLAFDIGMFTVDIYGGGYGHGSGMVQYGAGDLAKNYGASYKQILSHYYTGAKLVDMSEIPGVEQEIKIGITRPGGVLEHKNIDVLASGRCRVYGENGDFDFSLGPNTDIRVTAKAGKLYFKSSEKEFSSSSPFYIDGNGDSLVVKNLGKTHTNNPRYRGKLYFIPKGDMLYLVSVVDMEDYLKQVVPSEMPRSFGVEALKVQSVAARTYAISDFLKGRYTNLGFHVKDTIESQVYNNQVENQDANRAIEETRGEILVYDGKPIDAKYSSTSSGFTEAAHHIW